MFGNAIPTRCTAVIQIARTPDSLIAPDYVVNAGGVMGASTMIFAEPSRETSIRQIEALQGTIVEILRRAETEGRPSSEIADAMALERIAHAGG